MGNRFVDKLQRYTPLDGAAIAALEKVTATQHDALPGKHLIRDGDRPGHVLIFLDGWAARYKILPDGSRQIMEFLMSGDACDLQVGMLATIDHGIQTLTRSRVAAVPGHEMDKVLQQHPAVARAMYIAQLADEGILRSWIVSIGRRTALERVAHLICELYVRRQLTGVAETDFDLPLSQTVLADALGLTAVHVNRMLRELKKEGIIAVSRGCISIMKAKELTRIAGFENEYLYQRTRLPH